MRRASGRPSVIVPTAAKNEKSAAGSHRFCEEALDNSCTVRGRQAFGHVGEISSHERNRQLLVFCSDVCYDSLFTKYFIGRCNIS